MRSTPSPLILPQKRYRVQSRGASGRYRRNPLQLRSSSIRHGEFVFASDRPALWRASRRFFQGVEPEPRTGANQYRAAHRTTGRLLNLKDELSLIMELLLAGAVRRPTVRPVAGDGRPEQAKRRKPCRDRSRRPYAVCTYCYGTHVGVAEACGVAPDLIKALLIDIEAAPLEARMKPILRYARNLTPEPGAGH